MRPGKRKAAPGATDTRSGKGENSLNSLFSPAF